MTNSGQAPLGPRVAAGVLAAVVLGLLVLLFAILYLAISPVQTALVTMGVLALILALVSYLVQSLSRDPSVQRAVSYGLGAMGFALLFATIWVIPPSGISQLSQLVDTLVVGVVLAVALVLIFWRVRTTSNMEIRQEHRESWDQSRPPSAFDYASAHTPGSSPVGSSPPPPTQRSP